MGASAAGSLYQSNGEDTADREETVRAVMNRTMFELEIAPQCIFIKICKYPLNPVTNSNPTSLEII
jgi:hypothetical protein